MCCSNIGGWKFGVHFNVMFHPLSTPMIWSPSIMLVTSLTMENEASYWGSPKNRIREQRDTSPSDCYREQGMPPMLISADASLIHSFHFTRRITLIERFPKFLPCPPLVFLPLNTSCLRRYVSTLRFRRRLCADLVR